jgi:hypothetical protein
MGGGAEEGILTSEVTFGSADVSEDPEVFGAFFSQFSRRPWPGAPSTFLLRPPPADGAFSFPVASDIHHRTMRPRWMLILLVFLYSSKMIRYYLTTQIHGRSDRYIFNGMRTLQTVFHCRPRDIRSRAARIFRFFPQK